MVIDRRNFIRTTTTASLVPSILSCYQKDAIDIDENELIKAANSPILNLKLLDIPIIIESMELLMWE
jgi:hypothetical protein